MKFIPPFLGEEVKSNAEKKIFEALQQLNIKNAHILHSLGLPKHKTKIYGEIDFVIVCERGIACLEIKGGRVECKEGRWLFTDRYGVEREKSEGPFSQVIGNMFSLKQVIQQRFPAFSQIKNTVYAAGVVFPDIEFTSRTQEIIPEIIYDVSTLDITKYINGIFDYWEGRQYKDSSKLSPNSIKEIVHFLRGEFSFIPSLSDRLDNTERRLIRLTTDQANVMDALSCNNHLLVEGNAGTGKTVLAVDFAVKQTNQGKKVLYLTFNKNLANNIAFNLSTNQNLKIINIHALFGEYVEIDLAEMSREPRIYFEETLPEKFYEYIKSVDCKSLSSFQYDVLVMDEGQDIIKPDFLFSLDYLLKGGFENGKWAVFYDEKQNIYNPEYTDGIELLESYHCTKFKLFVNCRNTVQIGTYSSTASGFSITDFIKENGEEVQKVSYSSTDDYAIKMKDILKYLNSEKVRMQDITFLSFKKYSKTKLAEAGIMVSDISLADNDEDLPKFSTIQGYKGLDSKIVILCDADDIAENSFSKYIYIAATRARSLLYAVGSQDFWNKHNELRKS